MPKKSKLTKQSVDGIRLHILDMGKTMYGDSLICEIGKRRILIDGGHLADANPKDGHPSLPAQMKAILGGNGPYRFDLLVVTHCHADHIGCLPGLVSQGVITAAKALVADPDLGWGKALHDSAPLPRDDQEARALAAVREEDVSQLPSDELDEFLADAAKLGPSYRDMLSRLEQKGCDVVRYTEPADARKIETAFKDIKLKVHGPTKNHLEVCSRAIAKIGRDALDSLTRARATDAAVDAVRLILSDISIDREGIGAALNDQSIILSFEVKGRRILLLGDMQLAVPEVPGLETEMATLLAALAKAGPFDLIKTPHHTSYNGIDKKVLAAFPQTNVWVHSGGSQDAGHPERAALKELKALNKGKRKISFARTDRNGLISVALTAKAVAIKPSRGGFDDYTPNKVERRPPDPGLVARPAAAPQLTRSTVTTTPAGGRVEIHTFVPLGARVRVTLDVDAQNGAGSGPKGAPDTPGSFRLAGGRTLNPLLFVTSEAKLRDVVGPWADECLSAIRSGGHRIFDLRGETDAERAVAAVRTANGDPALAGVVLLGGPGIVPARIVDALPDEVREQVVDSADGDPDDFYVWSDEPYGDRDGDDIPELPVTRVPDGGSADFLRTVLSADAPAGNAVQRAGYRNIHRPFADGVYSGVRGTTPIVISELATPETIGDGAVTGDVIYIMLHGSDSDGSRFWGETADARGLLALTPENVGAIPGALVFTGCCWGAMTWSPIARRAMDGTRVTPRTVSSSLALRFLEKGARAFIGCTGAHYSPDKPPYNSAGGPMHRAFWKHITLGKPPARALFDAKIDYATWMRGESMTPESLAVSFKILRQYTCLGLGW